MKRHVIWLVSACALILAGMLGLSALRQTTGIVEAASQPTPEPAATGAPGTITVVGEGKVKIEPDLARAVIGVNTVGDTVEEATGKSAETMERLYAALTELGIAEKDFQTAGYSLWTDRQPKPDGLYVTIRDLNRVGEVLDAAIKAGANTIHSLSFGLADTESLESEARTKAVADAHRKAKELAELIGAQVGPALEISEVIASGGGYYQGGFREAMERAPSGMGGMGPVSPGEIELTLRIQIVYALER